MTDTTVVRIEIGGTGVVRYRCAACGELIDGEPMWTDRDTPDAQTYHTEHVPED